MNIRKWISLLLLTALILPSACQRFEKPEEQEGLDKDTHSYSYVSYPESKMKQVALDVPGVYDVQMEYNGKNVMMYIIPEKNVKPEEYHELANRIHSRVSQAAPITPFHIRIIRPKPRFDGDRGY